MAYLQLMGDNYGNLKILFTPSYGMSPIDKEERVTNEVH